MLRFTLMRILAAIPTMFAVVAIAFFMVRAAPGGPFDSERVLAPEIEANFAAAYHLDEPVSRQFLRYLNGLLHADFGPSYRYRAYSVSEIIGMAAPVSFLLGGLAMLVAIVVGFTLGLAAALKRNTIIDRAISAVAIAGISVPVLVIAPLLVLVFAVRLGWLPAGFVSGSGPAQLVLPVAALALPLIAYIARLFRASMVEVLQSDFIRTARSQGLSTAEIVRYHALKPALLPLLSYLGPALVGVLTGSVVVEQVFGIPGLGQFFVNSALNRDYTLIMGLVIFYAALVIVMNLLVDILYGFIDPRIRYR